VVREDYYDPYLYPRESDWFIDGLIKLRMILFRWQVGLLFAMYINVDFLKHMLGWDVYYLMNWQR
jgi:hypothetical protein